MSEQVTNSDHALTVSTLASLLTETLQSAFPSTVTLDAEISNFKAYPSGHWYFSLTDGQATLSAVMFKGNNRAVRLVARDGLQVRTTCEVNFYPPNGKLQLIVKSMAEAGLGDQKAKLDALRAKLIAEGLTDPNRKRPLPSMPTSIGLITSAKGAVIQDMLTVLKRRWPLAEIRLYSAAVQGEAASAELNAALARAIGERRCDVLIIGRGGGASEDFNAFNDESLCRAIAACPIPIVSAVGHETDTGLTDLVADVRAATPSQAAELVSPDQIDIINRLNGLSGRLVSRAQTQIALAEQRLELNIQRLSQRMDTQCRNHRDRLVQLQSRLLPPTEYIAIKRGDLVHLAGQLGDRMHRQLEAQRTKLSALAGQLDVLSPLATLGRGYGIVLKTDSSSDRTIGSITDVEEQSEIEIRLRDGRLGATVTQIQQES